MRTRYDTFRVGLWPAVSLATVGVVLTTVIVGYGASRILGLGLMEGMLIGAIIGSTDAAAVFSCCMRRACGSSSGSAPPWKSSPAATIRWPCS